MITIKRFESISEIPQEFFLLSNPFQSAWYLNTYIKHFCKKEDVFFFGFYNDETCIGYAGFEKIENKMPFLGMKPVLNGQEVTDYGDIVIDSSYKNYSGEIWDELLKWFSQNSIQSLQLDYVREDSPTYDFFKGHAIQQGIAPHIILPKTWDEYLESLDRVDRKELKRKMRRLEAIPYMYRSIDKSIQSDFEEFVRLHKLSSREKQEFMSEEMKRFFLDLITVEKNTWKTGLSFLQIEGKNAAAIFSFENESTVFGYNSGHDPSLNYYSVGLLLHAYKIKMAIESGKTIYDFMRGTERYKYDLGGRDMKLYKINILLKK